MNTKRIPFLDMLRGFAITGILLVNIGDITRLGDGLDTTARMAGNTEPAQQVLYYLVSCRFVPIFMFLFGISMGLITRSLRSRGERAWPQLMRRMVALFGFGMLHSLVYPGEVLREYAIFGLIVLPLVLCCSRRILLAIGLAGTLVTFMIGGGSAALPGMFCLGAACAAYDLPQRLETAGRGTRPSLWITFALSIPALIWQVSQPGDPRFTTAGGDAGMIMTMLYICALSLLWQTRARNVLTILFTPLGRMAFSNYVSASLLAVLAGKALDFRMSTTVLPALGVAVTILVAQNLVSRWWLAHFAYGPLEWCWRVVTRWQPVALRRISQKQGDQPKRSAEREVKLVGSIA